MALLIATSIRSTVNLSLSSFSFPLVNQFTTPHFFLPIIIIIIIPRVNDLVNEQSSLWHAGIHRDERVFGESWKVKILGRYFGNIEI